jgi:hypothetical protein
MDIFHDIEHVLEDDFRKPIRTGIHGLDDIMDGGARVSYCISTVWCW